MINIFLLALMIFFQTHLFAEELIIIKAVSDSGRSFAINKGFVDGISQGQESLFTSNDASFKARAIAVEDRLSLWELPNPRGQVPFQKDEYVSFSNSLENIWTQIPRTAFIERDELGFEPHPIWAFKFHYSYAIAEAVSGTDSSQYAGRQGLQFEALYGKRISMDWEIAGGVRFDRETSTLQNPSLTIPTNRFLVTGEGTYHFYRFPSTENNLYLTAGMAYGLSNTTVSGQSSSGTAMILPIVKLGFVYKQNIKYTWLFESTFETLSAEESFNDSSIQTTNATNIKMGVGLRY